MKRSKNIQLVLITAAFASCNHVILPPQKPSGIAMDSALIGPSPDSGTPHETTFNICCQEAFPQRTYSFNPYALNNITPPGSLYYYPGGLYRKGSFWRKDHFIVRGGWGKAGNSAVS